ncbi:MAG: hypothetical protein EZS28_023461 [Streblomastix strix]|uniref:Uncharacterized protein n=1 Tax=Streblomastix strix TaxID=222440 RepID=A0A5J4VEV2_9EUKA|nr:MAG: hypothetical protein EZS28_023461 [Streblomastix strix]
METYKLLVNSQMLSIQVHLYKQLLYVEAFLKKIVLISQMLSRKEWTTTGGRRYGFAGPRSHHSHVQTVNVSVTIPEGWTFGRINWYGQQQIIGQKVTFSLANKGEAEVPSIPIIKLN